MKNKKNQLIRNSTAEFLIFTGQAGEQSIEARYEDETIWLSQKLMAQLFDVKVTTINEHLKNIFDTGELDRKATIRKFLTVQVEGKREVSRKVDYNRDAPTTKAFFAKVRNKLHFAIHGHTAAELIMQRADSSKANMGPPGKRPRTARF